LEKKLEEATIEQEIKLKEKKDKEEVAKNEEVRQEQGIYEPTEKPRQ
jgi:hypothetical protein